MRLLKAELRKLRRPLVGWSILTVVMVSAMFSWFTQRNVANEIRFAGQSGLESCGQLGLPEGKQCDLLRADRQRAGEEFRDAVRAEALAKAQEVRPLQHPVGVGRLAAGQLASLLGAAIIVLVAATHVGGEWGGRTIKAVLTHEVRRWRVLLAKGASLWLLGVGLLLISWACLALLSPLFRSWFPLPVQGLSIAEAWGAALPQVARALLVVAVFSDLGTAAAMVTRNPVGGVFLGWALLAASLFGSKLALFAQVTPVYAVAGWMGFRNRGVLSDHLWVDTYPGGVPLPSHAGGLIGLLVVAGICCAVAYVAISKRDVTV